MPSPLPSRLDSAHLAWTDLAAAMRRHPRLSAIAVAACTAVSLATAYLNPEDDVSASAIARGAGLAVIEAFLITPVLLASHRFVILGETTQHYGRALTAPRFWRFFLLSAAIVAMLFVPVLVTRWRLLPDEISSLALVAGILAFVAVSLLLSLMFPAIAVDAPGTSIRNAVGDLWGNVWHIFWVGVIAMLPLLLATMAIGGIQAMIFDDLNALSLRIAFAPFEGAMSAATYVVLVLIASRFYLALGARLSQSPSAAT
jgi:hypothetical protein